MPANLTPEFREAEERFRSAQGGEEKLAALEAMLRAIPKHKGTEKMQADIKRRIAKLKAEAARRPATARQRAGRHVPREGAGQVVLVGPPNSGKSSLVAVVTNARPVVADYPFSTREPLPGMMPYENLQIQLVDMPPLAPGLTPPWIFGLIRGADAILLVFDLSDPALVEQAEDLKTLLAEGKVGLARAVIAGTRADIPGAADNLALLPEILGPDIPAVAISATRGDNLPVLQRRLFDALGVIRIYTRAPGKRPDLNAPFVLPLGTTLVEAAAAVHKDFALSLKFARVWGKGTFDGQMVQRDHVLHDGDVVELHR
ncbi:MAG TPA: GTP-binding protein HSR1 [Clostridiales bacterium]|nr:GTP-binding protein HSR1 [Clostridiales bacterium]